MPRKPDLQQAITNATSRPVETLSRPQIVRREKNENPNFRPSREGKSNVTGYFPREVKKQLRLIAAGQDTTIEDCLAEALNDYFAKHGKPELAPRKAQAAAAE